MNQEADRILSERFDTYEKISLSTLFMDDCYQVGDNYFSNSFPRDLAINHDFCDNCIFYSSYNGIIQGQCCNCSSAPDGGIFYIDDLGNIVYYDNSLEDLSFQEDLDNHDFIIINMLNNFDLNGEHINCSICFCEDISTSDSCMIDICNHTFCKSCIYEWLKINNICPLCRSEVLSITIYE
jgi:hypothetical protein